MIAARALAAAIVVGALVWLLHDLPVAALGDALRRIGPASVAALVALGLAILATRACAWRVLLGPAVPLRAQARLTLAAYAASTLLPLRAGEGYRIWRLAVDHGVPMTRALGVALADKVATALALVVVVAPLPLLRPLPTPVEVGLALALGLGAVAIFLVRRRARGDGRWARVVEGAAALGRPRTLALTLLILAFGWLLDLAAIALLAGQLELGLGGGDALLVLATINLAVAAPSTPAQLGAVQLGAIVGLQAAGVGRADALAFGLAYHAAQVLPTLALGLAIEGRRLFARPPEASRG